MRLLLLLCLSLPAFGDFVFTARPCGGSYDPCDVQAIRRTPTAAETAGLTQKAFTEFYGPLLDGRTGDFGWWIRDSDPSGTIIGSVGGPNDIDGDFVFKNGKLGCCYNDNPWTVFDINDFGVMVAGVDYDPIISSTPNGESLADIPYTILPLPGDLYVLPDLFYAIDNHNRILANIDILKSSYNGERVYKGLAILTPVPEPSSVILLASFLIGAFAIALSRSRSNALRR